MKNIHGRVWKLGDHIDTDIIIPARYLVLPIDEMKLRAMEPMRPELPPLVKKGDILVAGRNFGCGSSREQAPVVLRELGIECVVAASFARIFFRNAINVGLPVVECEELYGEVVEGETVSVDAASGEITIDGRDGHFHGSKLPDFLLEILDDGGLIGHNAARRAGIVSPPQDIR